MNTMNPNPPPELAGASIAPALPGLIPQAHRDHVLQVLQAQLHDNQGQRITHALIVGVLEITRHLVPVAPPAPPERTAVPDPAPTPAPAPPLTAGDLGLPELHPHLDGLIETGGAATLNPQPGA